MSKDTTDLANWARECGLRLSTYSPGDGVTRYRFAAPEDQRISERVSDTAQTVASAREVLASNYFACSAIATVLGRKAAAEWLSAYSIGYQRGRASRELAILSPDPDAPTAPEPTPTADLHGQSTAQDRAEIREREADFRRTLS